MLGRMSLRRAVKRLVQLLAVVLVLFAVGVVASLAGAEPVFDLAMTFVTLLLFVLGGAVVYYGVAGLHWLLVGRHRPGRPPLPYRFNPPPGWPDPGPGWVPDDAWRPDPAWPAVPPGWGLWERTEPRPRGLSRLGDLTDLDHTRTQLRSLVGRYRITDDVREIGQVTRDLVTELDAKSVADRNPWHPVEWSFRRACEAVTEHADALLADLEDPPGSHAPGADDLAERYLALYRLADEMFDVAYEGAYVDRDIVERVFGPERPGVDRR